MKVEFPRVVFGNVMSGNRYLPNDSILPYVEENIIIAIGMSY